MTDDDLLPCPFCGGKAETYPSTIRLGQEQELRHFWIVDCTICNAAIEFNGTQDSAIKTWNTRANDNQSITTKKSTIDEVKITINRMNFEYTGRYVADRILKQLEQMK